MIREQRMRVELPAVLSLGSNLGDREATLRAAVAHVGRIPGVVVTAASALVETFARKPTGVDEDAPPYLNAVVAVRTSLDPGALLDALNSIEQAFGRVRLEQWDDRTLDIDIVVMDGIVLSTDRLALPHPRAFERSFVLVPWLQIEPDAELPGHGRVDALAEADPSGVRIYNAEGLL